MDFFDDDFEFGTQNENAADDFTDDFFDDDDISADSAEVITATRPRFNRSVPKPEPINLGNEAPSQESFAPMFTPTAEDPMDYPEVEDNQKAPAEPEADSHQEAPAYQEVPSYYDKSPVECLTEYADCHYKFIPCGTDVNELNRKYIYALHYGREWGYSAVMIPVSPELSERLCFDRSGRPIGADALRAMRRETVAASSGISRTDEIDAVYAQKTSVMAQKGINIQEFEYSDNQGAVINCFSSFVKNGVTTKDILIFQVPVTEPWNVFAWFPVGGINGSPSNETLISASKHWNELCGAVPAVLGYGTVEYFVPNGRPSYDAALQIAREQFALCHERVLRLTRSHTLSELVDTLTKSCVWYLGWK